MTHVKKILTRAFGLSLLVCISQAARAEPVTTLVNNGDSANRLDIVIMGDGYTSGEMNKYRSDVQTFVNYMFSQEPFAPYRYYINVHRIDVVSAESGADKPDFSPPVYKNTALGAYYNCASVQRLICIDVNTANAVLAAS